MLPKMELKKEFQSRSKAPLSANAMKIAVKALKQHQESKGYLFQCFVCNRETNHDELLQYIVSDRNHHDELLQFLNAIQTKKSQWVNGSRCQLLYKEDNHWSVMDMQIINGQLSFYLLDTVHAYPTTLSALNLIYDTVPKAKIVYHRLVIQNSRTDCDYFALDHALSLSKIEELHQLLPQYIHQGPLGRFQGGYPAYIEFLLRREPFLESLNTPKVINAIRNVNYLSSINLPKEFGSLLKNMQSISYFKDFYAGHGYIRHNEGSLDDYILKHSVTKLTAYREPKVMNLALEYKANKIKIRALQYLANESSPETSPRLEMINFLNAMTRLEEVGKPSDAQFRSCWDNSSKPIVYTNGKRNTGAKSLCTLL